MEHREGDFVTLVKIPEGTERLPAETQQAFQHCLQKSYRITEITDDGLLVLDVSRDVDTVVGGKFNDLRVEPDCVQATQCPVQSAALRPSEQLAMVYKKYSGHPEFLGVAITDPNQSGALDSTLLHIAAETGAREDIQILIAAGARVDAIGDLGNTPLHAAAMMGQVESVKLLLEHGANKNLTNEFGQTPVAVAEIGEKDSVVKFLNAWSK